MKFNDFKMAHNEAAMSSNEETYIAEAWYPYWAEAFCENNTILFLKEIYALSKISEIKQLGEHYNISVAALCRKCEIPNSTGKKWSEGSREMKGYTMLFIKYILFEEYLERILEEAADE